MCTYVSHSEVSQGGACWLSSPPAPFKEKLGVVTGTLSRKQEASSLHMEPRCGPAGHPGRSTSLVSFPWHHQQPRWYHLRSPQMLLSPLSICPCPSTLQLRPLRLRDRPLITKLAVGPALPLTVLISPRPPSVPAGRGRGGSRRQCGCSRHAFQSASEPFL